MSTATVTGPWLTYPNICIMERQIDCLPRLGQRVLPFFGLCADPCYWHCSPGYVLRTDHIIDSASCAHEGRGDDEFNQYDSQALSCALPLTRRVLISGPVLRMNLVVCEVGVLPRQQVSHASWRCAKPDARCRPGRCNMGYIIRSRFFSMP